MSSSPLPWEEGLGGEGKTLLPSGFHVKLTPMGSTSLRDAPRSLVPRSGTATLSDRGAGEAGGNFRIY